MRRRASTTREAFRDLSTHSIYFCRVTHSLPQPILVGVPTILAFDTELDDRFNMHNPAVNSRITFTEAGIYTIISTVQWDPNPVGNRTLDIILNGVTTIARAADDSLGGGIVTVQIAGGTRRFNMGDFLQVQVTHTDGAVLNVQTVPEFTPIFSVALVGLT